jgi:hypothetical protein
VELRVEGRTIVIGAMAKGLVSIGQPADGKRRAERSPKATGEQTGRAVAFFFGAL